MTRTLALQAGIGAAAGAAGLAMLTRPGTARRLLRLPAAEATTYVLRIGGMMLAALGLFLFGFALAFASAGGTG